MSKCMVAVYATQPGATFTVFDDTRFISEIVGRTKAFLQITDRTCAVLLVFQGGRAPLCEELRIEHERCRLVPVTPGYLAARQHFLAEMRERCVYLLVRPTDWSETEHLCCLMKRYGAERVWITDPSGLAQVAFELESVQL